MSELSQLIRLMNGCRGSVYVELNPHRNVYQSVKDYMEEQNFDVNMEVEPWVYEKMVERDTIVSIQFYPHTPVGFYHIYHYDLEQGLDEAITYLEKEI